MTLLDTHVLVWLRVGDPRLGRRVRIGIDRALQSNEVAVSAISFWELEMLQKKHRIHFGYAVDQWRRLLLEEGLVEIPLDGESHPGGRLHSACSRHRQAGHQLVTADRRIHWGTLSRVDASQ